MPLWRVIGHGTRHTQPTTVGELENQQLATPLDALDATTEMIQIEISGTF
jgi:hypothetical protein